MPVKSYKFLFLLGALLLSGIQAHADGTNPIQRLIQLLLDHGYNAEYIEGGNNAYGVILSKGPSESRSNSIPFSGEIVDVSISGLDDADLKAVGQNIFKETVLRSMVFRNCKFKDSPHLSGARISQLKFFGCSGLESLEPLKELSELNSLWISGSQVSDLSPLKSLNLQTIWVNDAPIIDLAPLSNMKLQHLTLKNTEVSRLDPIWRHPLKVLDLHGSPVEDLAPIKNSPITDLTIPPTVQSLDPLRGMPLNNLNVYCNNASTQYDYSVLRKSLLGHLAILCDPGDFDLSLIANSNLHSLCLAQCRSLRNVHSLTNAALRQFMLHEDAITEELSLLANFPFIEVSVYSDHEPAQNYSVAGFLSRYKEFFNRKSTSLE